jgi:YfiH family protein
LVPPAATISIADEQAIQLVDGEVTALFSLGPAAAEQPRQDRIGVLLQTLAPSLRAARWCLQVHGSLLASLSDEPAAPLADAACVGRCDGLLSAERGLGLLVWTADCVPVLMWGGGVIAAVHAGWRGAAAGIVPACLRRFQVEYGVTADQVTASLGPAIGPCHYPVGTEVIEALSAGEVRHETWLDGDRVDLRAFVKGQLIRAGAPEPGIITTGGCTACDPRLASYRRDGAAAGRQWSLIWRNSGT